LNCILRRETDVDGEITMIDSLGLECRRRDEKKNKEKKMSSEHKIVPSSAMILSMIGSKEPDNQLELRSSTFTPPHRHRHLEPAN